MRICLLTTSTTAHQMGGTEVQAEILAAEAARQGHDVLIITTAHPKGLKAEERNGYRVIYLDGTSHTMSRRTAPDWWRASAERTEALCASGNMDVVWAANFSGLSYAALPRAARRPVISIVQGLAVRGEIASNFGRVSTPGELLYFLTRYAAQTLFYYIPRFRAMVRDSDLLIGVSNETVAALEKEFPESRGKSVAILNPVDTEVFRPDPRLRAEGRGKIGFSPKNSVVLMSGVLHKQKGVHLGLEAFAAVCREFPGARLAIAGEGPERARLQELCLDLGISGKVAFRGLVPNAEMPLYYNAADIFLNPTLRLEGLPLVLLEAMSCGLPCVTSRIGGTGSSIEDGKSGYFTEPGNTRELSAKLRILLAGNELRAGLSAGARTRAVEVFDKRRVLKEYISASRRVMDGQ